MKIFYIILYIQGNFVLSLQWICEETKLPRHSRMFMLKLISGYNFRVPSAAGTADGFPQDQTLGIASTKSPCLCSKCPVEHQESEWDNHFIIMTHQNIPHSWINERKKPRKKHRHLTAIDALLWCSINIIISSRSVGSGIAKKMPEHWGMWRTTFPNALASF